MNASGIPGFKITIPWASGETVSYLRTPPNASQIPFHDGWASWTDGFPPLNFSPVESGGVPPDGRDVNGVNNILSSWMRWYIAGGPIPYDSAFATAIGGYPKGAQVTGVAVPSVVWVNSIDGNTTDPETPSDPVSWLSQTAGRLLRVSIYSAPGTYGFTPLPNTNKIRTFAIGGGASGCGCPATSSSQNAVGSGGGSGAYGIIQLIAGQFTAGSSIPITIGSGGAPLNGGANNGTATSFGSFLTCPGGYGGGYILISATGAGVASQGLPGPDPTVGIFGTQIIASRGAPGQCGLIVGGSPMSGQGANSPYGGGGTNTANTAAGGSGVTGASSGVPGSGGGGAASQVSAAICAGGRGGNGWIMAEEYAA